MGNFRSRILVMEKIIGLEKDTVVLELVKEYDYQCVYAWEYINLSGIGDSIISKTLLIAYPKGKRPKLPYPQNKKESI